MPYYQGNHMKQMQMSMQRNRFNPIPVGRGNTQPIIYSNNPIINEEEQPVPLQFNVLVNENGNYSIIIKPLITCCSLPKFEFSHKIETTGENVFRCKNCGRLYSTNLSDKIYDEKNVAKILPREVDLSFGKPLLLDWDKTKMMKNLIPPYNDHNLRIPLIFSEDNFTSTKNLAVFLYRKIVEITNDTRVSRKYSDLERKWIEDYDNLSLWNGKAHSDMLQYAQNFDWYDEEDVIELLDIFCKTFLKMV